MKHLPKTLLLALCLVPALAACNLFGESRWESPQEGSRIVVYRPGNVTGFAKRFMLTLNGRKQASIGNGEYFVMDVPPGRFTLAIEDTEVELSVAAPLAQAQYIVLQVDKPAKTITASLAPVSYETARQALQILNEAPAYETSEALEEGQDMQNNETGPRS